MSRSGASRFTAVLATVAVAGVAGTFWWALETRSQMKAAASRGVGQGLSPAAAGRIARSKDERSDKIERSDKVETRKFESNKFKLMGKSEPTQPRFKFDPPPAPSDRNEDLDEGSERPAPLLANYPNPGPAQDLQPPRFRSLRSESPGMSRGADMPLPALPSFLARPGPANWKSKESDPPTAVLPPPPASPPAGNPKRQTRTAPSTATRAPKPPAQSFYVERFVEDGEYRYRRRACEPPNMPDVCFMPPSDRQPIVVAKP